MSEGKHVKQRSVYLDVIKGVAIILVVFAHCIQWGSGENFYNNHSYFSDVLFKLIYSFHMPLFMVVSGFLFWNTVCHHNIKKIIISRIKHLLLPIIVWQSLFLVFIILYKDVPISIGLLHTYLGALWFLWSVLISSLLVCLGHVLFRDSILFYFILLITMMIFPDKIIKGIHVFMYPYFVVGYLWNKWNCYNWYQNKSVNEKWLIVLVSMGVFLLLYYFFDTPEKSIYINGVSLYGRDNVFLQLGINVIRYIYGGLGVIIVMILVNLLPSSLFIRYPINTIVILGMNTMGIYIINNYTTQLLLFLPVSSNYCYVLSLLECVLMLAVSYILVLLIMKSRLLKGLLFG